MRAGEGDQTAAGASRQCHDAAVTLGLPLLLGVVDGLAAIYLLVWALRRERRDKPAVAIVGGVLGACAAFLLFLAVFRDDPSPAPPSAPVPTTAPSTAAV